MTYILHQASLTYMALGLMNGFILGDSQVAETAARIDAAIAKLPGLV